MPENETDPLDQILDRMRAARRAPRCVHVKTNGVRCGSPALRRQPYCFFHENIHNPPFEASFPPLEDANSVQVALMQVIDGVLSKKLDQKTAAVLLYGLQTASANLKRTNFEPGDWQVVQRDPLLEDREQEAAALPLAEKP